MISLGEQIKARRKELRLTLRDLGAKCGLTASFLCDLERGKRRVGADSLLAISQALGIPMDQLMRGQPGELAGATTKTFDLPASLVTLAHDTDMPFRHAACLYWLARTIMDHRIPSKRTDLARFDWAKFYGAVKDFL